MLAAYADNASYEEDASVAKAKAFATACRSLLSPGRIVKRSAAGGRGGNEVELMPELLQQQLEDARRWLAAELAAASGGSAVIHADFTGFRE